MLSNFAALQTDDAAEARRYVSLALRIPAGVWDQSPDVEVRLYARRSLESTLVSLRTLLARPELPDELRSEAEMTLSSFWYA
jgi:hypothetical protein